MRSGFCTPSYNEAGSPLKGGKSGASTEPQWCNSRGVVRWVFAILTALSSPKCHSLSEKSKIS
jgi:hypothetical protein